MKVLFQSIVPSPYQRDIFACLNQQDGIEIEVHYAEAGSPDSPWPKAELASYEKVYKSFYLSWQGKRFIINRQLPDLDGFDAVVLNGYVTIPAQWILRTSKQIPVLFWGEKLDKKQGGLREKMQALLTRPMRHSAAIVAIGKKAARDYKERFPEVPVFEVPYYCRIDNFQEAVPARPRNPVTILYCGQMIHRKGVDLLIEAFSRILSTGMQARLLLVGREAELPTMLENVPETVRSHIEFAGFQAPEDLPRFFQKADLFVLPSRYDGWGVVVNQALGSGLPAICSDAVGAAEDLIAPGENGFIFPSEDVDALEKALAELVQSPGKIGQFGENALHRSQSLTPEQGARDWIKILNSVISK